MGSAEWKACNTQPLRTYCADSKLWSSFNFISEESHSVSSSDSGLQKIGPKFGQKAQCTGQCSVNSAFIRITCPLVSVIDRLSWIKTSLSLSLQMLCEAWRALLVIYKVESANCPEYWLRYLQVGELAHSYYLAYWCLPGEYQSSTIGILGSIRRLILLARSTCFNFSLNLHLDWFGKRAPGVVATSKLPSGPNVSHTGH